MSPEISVEGSDGDPYSKPVQSIYCIGQNYLKHIQELQNKIPDAPVVFIKPVSAIVTSTTLLDFPIEKGVIHYEVELVLLLGKTGRRIDKSEAWNYVEAYTAGIDFTMRDLQADLREKGLPWLLSKGFDHSAALANFRPIPGPDEFEQLEFWLDLNGSRKQTGTPEDMVFDIPTILTFLSRTITLQEGDLLFTGTPAGVDRVRSGDSVSIGVGENIKKTFTIK